MAKNKNKKATIYEVAKEVGVSTATVSRVLNDSPNVSDDTKKKILKVIKELNFRPQVTARKLAGGKPQMLAVVVPSFTTPFYNEVLKGIKDEIRDVDLDIMMYNTGSRNREKGMQRFFDRGMADAFLIISIDINEEVHRQLQATQIPVVLVNSTHPAYNYYGVDDYKGGYIAGEHLARQGFRSIGMISSALETEASTDRKQGFMDALHEHDLEVADEFFVKGDTKKHAGFTEESGFEAISKLEKLGRFPEAIFCSNDTQAIGAIYALSKLGMEVPDDIAVMGYDNIKLSKYLDLTTVDQKMYTIGVQAIRRLTEIIERPVDKPYQTVVSPVLVERGTTRNTSGK